MEIVELIASWGRLIERLIIVSSGAIAIWLGYRLFDKVVSDKGAFAASTGSMSIRMQRLAPGVFFALFGAVVLIFGLQNPLSIVASGSDPSAQNSTPAADSVVWGQGSPEFHSDEAAVERAIRAITTVQNLTSRGLVQAPQPENHIVLQDAVQALVRYRDKMIDSVVGEEAMARYLEIEAALRRDASALDKRTDPERARYERVKGLLRIVQLPATQP